MKKGILTIFSLIILISIVLAGCSGIQENRIPSIQSENITLTKQKESPRSEPSVPPESPSEEQFLVSYRTGMKLMGQGNYSGAIQYFNHSINLNNSFKDAYYSRGLSYLEMGKTLEYELKGTSEFQSSISDFTEFISSDPGNSTAYTSRGWSYYWLAILQGYKTDIITKESLNNFDRAINDFSQALELDPQSLDATEGRALALLYRSRGGPKLNTIYWHIQEYRVFSTGIPTEIPLNDDGLVLGLQDLNKFSNYPSDPRGPYARSLYYLSDGIYPLAKDGINQAIQLNPKNARYWYTKGQINIFLDKTQAYSDFSEAIRLEPRYAAAYNARAFTQDQLDWRKENSLADMDNALRINSEIAKIHYNLAYKMSDIHRGYKYEGHEIPLIYLNKASELDPSCNMCHYRKALMLTYLGRNPEAQSELNIMLHNAKTQEEKEWAEEAMYIVANIANYPRV